MRGAASPVHPSALPRVEGAPPLHPGVFAGRQFLFPMRRALRLSDPGPDDARGRSPPLHSPVRRALRPSTPGDFPDAGKVTKGAPRAVPFGIPRCRITALFALAPLCSDSRRATFNHRTRPICHFEFVGKSVLFFPLLPLREHFLLSIRGAAGGAPEDA